MGASFGAPGGFPPGPAVIVVQEWWGLDDHIRSFVDRFARAGFAAIAPDLYRGAMAEEPDDAKKLAMAFDREAAVEDLQSCVSFLLEAGATSVGAIGFCMGGGLVWQLASADERLGAAVPCYGTGDGEPRCPVQFHVGSEDRWSSEELDELESRLAALGNGSEVFRYVGARHAFMNDTREAHDPEAASAAWKRALAFLEQHLGSPVLV